MSLTPITDLKRELATLRELREYDAAIIAKLRLELDAALAALRDIIKAVDVGALKLGEGDNAYFNYAGNRVISEARAVIEASQGGEQ